MPFFCVNFISEAPTGQGVGAIYIPIVVSILFIIIIIIGSLTELVMLYKRKSEFVIIIKIALIDFAFSLRLGN